MTTEYETAYDVICRKVQRHHEMAQEAFADHEIETKLLCKPYRHYICSNGGSSIYRFHMEYRSSANATNAPNTTSYRRFGGSVMRLKAWSELVRKVTNANKFDIPTKPQSFPRDGTRDRIVLGVDVVDTCTSHPEQYDVFIEDVRVGYLRLRGGWFHAACPTAGGSKVYSAIDVVKGDGEFLDEERDGFIEEAFAAILEWCHK